MSLELQIALWTNEQPKTIRFSSQWNSSRQKCESEDERMWKQIIHGHISDIFVYNEEFILKFIQNIILEMFTQLVTFIAYLLYFIFFSLKFKLSYKNPKNTQKSKDTINSTTDYN